MDVTTPGLCEADLALERALAQQQLALVGARTRERRMAALDLIKALTARRSAAAILALERAQGLQPHS